MKKSLPSTFLLALLSLKFLGFVISAFGSEESAYVYENEPQPRTPFNRASNVKRKMEIIETLKMRPEYYSKRVGNENRPSRTQKSKNKFTIENIFNLPSKKSSGFYQSHKKNDEKNEKNQQLLRRRPPVRLNTTGTDELKTTTRLVDNNQGYNEKWEEYSLLEIQQEVENLINKIFQRAESCYWRKIDEFSLVTKESNEKLRIGFKNKVFSDIDEAINLATAGVANLRILDEKLLHSLINQKNPSVDKTTSTVVEDCH